MAERGTAASVTDKFIGNQLTMAESTSTTVTTINNLPDECLAHILSFLPTLEAIEAGMVARKWLNLWHRAPVLSFDIMTSYKKSTAAAPFSVTRAQLADRISRVFFVRDPMAPLHHFRLAFHYADFGDREMEVRYWIRSAANLRILKLELLFYDDEWMIGNSRADRLPAHFNNYNSHTTFQFRFSDVRNSSITELRLQGGSEFCCYVNFDISDFDSLKTIFLSNVEFSFEEEIEGLLSGCKNLRNMTIERFVNSGLDLIKIHSYKLQTLTLRGHSRTFYGFTTLSIDAPALQSLKIISFTLDEYMLEVPSLIDADIDFGNRYEHSFYRWHETIIEMYKVRRLRIQNMAIRHDYTEYGWLLSRFKYLNHLELITGYDEKDLLGIFEFIRMSPFLESLVLDYRYYLSASVDYDEDVFYYDLVLSEEFQNKPINPMIFYLRKAVLKNYRKTHNEIYLVELFKKYKVVLEEIVAIPPPHGKALSSLIVLWSIDSAVPPPDLPIPCVGTPDDADETQKLDAANKAGGEGPEGIKLPDD